jgi:hypothetical protein
MAAARASGTGLATGEVLYESILTNPPLKIISESVKKKALELGGLARPDVPSSFRHSLSRTIKRYGVDNVY